MINIRDNALHSLFKYRSIKLPLIRSTSSRSVHTFYELSQRAGCDARIIVEVCGHGSSSGSSSNRSYGEFPDAVLLKETKKVWDLIEDITGALNQQEQ